MIYNKESAIKYFNYIGPEGMNRWKKKLNEWINAKHKIAIGNIEITNKDELIIIWKYTLSIIDEIEKESQEF